MKKTQAIASLLIISLLAFCPIASAHSGRTDSSGGHHDYQNKSGLGSYHYHHGYGPHLHPNGICPYSDNTSTTSSTSSIKKSGSTKTSTPTPKKDPTATVVSFPIQINNTIIDNTALEYPFLLYKDITYIPLTYRNLTSIGCSMTYENSVFSIHTSQKAEYMADHWGQSTKGEKKTITTDLSYTIYIDNTYYTQETDWPIFNYNGVTYMPLTTNTANTLNLWLTWDATNGIGINTYEK